MTKNFTKHLVFHRNVGLAPHVVAELGLNHHDRGFNVAALVVVREELFPIQREVVKHFLPNAATVHAGRSLFERNVSCGIDREHGFQITNAGIPFVSQDLVDLKMLRSLVNQRRQQRGIVGMLPLNLYRRNHVRFDAAHDVRLNPIVLLFDHAVFLIKPASEAGSHETRRIHSEVSFNSLERQGAPRNQASQDWRQIGILKIVENLL